MTAESFVRYERAWLDSASRAELLTLVVYARMSSAIQVAGQEQVAIRRRMIQI